MKESTRKALTLYLGECWHEKRCPTGNIAEMHTCKKCGCAYHPLYGSRTFTTPDDADALRRKMVEKGDWREFIIFSYDKYPLAKSFDSTIRETIYGFTNYLMDNFNELCSKWLEEKNK